ncbi:MAG TPA: aspartyl protease family protein [Terriglobales bacterium]|nr:aspartyl protease family protein [Terriglobales bacterium]
MNAVKNLCLFCLVLLPLCLTNPAWTTNPPQPDLIHSRSQVPFKLYAGYVIVLEGRIGNVGRLKFVLDTGVTHSVIDRKLASKIAGARRFGKVVSFDKSVPAEWVEVSEVQFGPIEVAPFSMMVSDLRYFQSFATKVDAVIGLDLLRLSSFSIDYDARKVLFGRIDTTGGVPMSSDPICLSVQLLVGDSKLQLLVDSGAPALVLYEDKILNRLPQLRIEGELDGVSMGGFVHAKKAVLADARLGTADLNGTVFLVRAPSDNVLSGIDGYLGTAALKARRIDFNFETKTLAWKR